MVVPQCGVVFSSTSDFYLVLSTLMGFVLLLRVKLCSGCVIQERQGMLLQQSSPKFNSKEAIVPI